jgi:hypothetical protein
LLLSFPSLFPLAADTAAAACRHRCLPPLQGSNGTGRYLKEAWIRIVRGMDAGSVSSICEETGLPLIQCTYCKRARLVERRTQQDSPLNYGRVYIKCPRNEKWVSLTLVFDFWLFDFAKD